MENKKIIFMGTPDYATTIFKNLIKYFNVVSLFTQPDKKVGRKQILTPPHIKKFCIDNDINIPIFQPNSLKDKDVINNIKDLKPDFIVVAAYGQILPKDILDIAPCINLHASLLPKYRGASPIQSAILNNDKYSGVTAMLMDEGLDSGDILSYSYINIENKNVLEVFNELSNIAATLIVEVLNNFSNIKPISQQNLLVSYSPKIKKEDGIVDFVDAKQIFLKYRAFLFWPSVFLKNKLKLTKIDLQEVNSNNQKGIILDIQKDCIIVGCQKGSIKIFEVNPPSKKNMDIISYINGKRLNIGDIFE